MLNRSRPASGPWLWLALGLAVASSAVAAPPRARAIVPAPSLGQDDAQAEAELERARADLDRARRLGDRAALSELAEWVAEEPDDARTRTVYARALRDVARWADARQHAEQAWRTSEGLPREARAAAARIWLAVLLDLGDAPAAQQALAAARDALQISGDARDAWIAGQCERLAGRMGEARAAWEAAANDNAPDWERQLARARCERALGDLVAASHSLVRAEQASAGSTAREPDILAELAPLYFESDGEIEHKEARSRAAGELYRAALALNKTHAPSLLGLFELGRFNWNRQNTPAHEWLAQHLNAAPDSIEGLLASAAADLDDGRLPSARETIARLERLAPARRELRTLIATLAWVEHRREQAEELLAELAAQAPSDGMPEREVARHLSELYRFAEAAPFAKRAVERAPDDHRAWMELGRALSNTGDEQGGLEALVRSQELAAGRQNAWRHNSILVLDRMAKQFVTERGEGDLRYSWAPQAADVLRTYWMPFYQGAREELSRRYGHTPGPVVIEVFDRFQDFSVRSTGFEGFPALGVCFGPVVTSVAPHSELRGKFSWARTSFHEFTHVVHLGLSHNRCPRWITEGLATWEEENKNPAWTRNMRRELLDAYANRDLILVRDLNRAFRSSRILFGYYMSGQLCRMLIEERGFPPMIRLLEAFDRGEDLDQAIGGVFGLSPEELDRQFAEYVRRTVEPLRIEPRWSPATVARLKVTLGEQRPAQARAAQEWSDGWCSIAWGYWQNGRKVDAEQALRRLSQSGDLPPRALFLQAEMAFARDEDEAAHALYQRALDAGGEDFRARMVLGSAAVEAERWDDAERHFLAAEQAYPGYPEQPLSAELQLARLYERREREDERFAALERWLKWDSDSYAVRMLVAERHAEHGRHERAVELFEGANQIDPFRRKLHSAWGRSLAALRRHAEAAREFGVSLQVPPELDPDDPEPLSDEARAELLGLQALELAELGRADEARARAEEARALDADCEPAAQALERLSRGS